MSLTEVVYYIRRLLPVVIIFILIVLIFYFAFRLLLAYLQTTNTSLQVSPSPQPVIIQFQPIFGKLPKIKLAQASPSGGYNYVIDTIEGKPLEATRSAAVYFLPKSANPSFGFLPKIYLMAKATGFDTEITKHKIDNENKYLAIFHDGIKTLTVDIINMNFTYQFTITKDNINFATDRLSNSQLESAAVEYLRQMNRYPPELAQGKRNLIYFNYNPDSNIMTQVEAPDAANMVEIDFYLPDINTYPVVPPKYFNSQNFVVFAITPVGPKVVKAQLQYFDKSKDQIGIYPLKSGEEVFVELKSGKGYIVAGKPLEGATVKIKQMLLAYLENEEYQPYLQPIYVYLGENNFVAYIQAVKEEYIGK